MLQQLPLLPPPPAIARDAETNDVIINARGRTEIRLVHVPLADRVRVAWEIVVLHRGKTRAVATSIRPLPGAIFHALIACMNVGLLQPPPRVERRWHGRRYWHITNRAGATVLTELGCRCRPECDAHDPLLTVLHGKDGTLKSECVGKQFVTDDALAFTQFVAEQLITHRYLR